MIVWVFQGLQELVLPVYRERNGCISRVSQTLERTPTNSSLRPNHSQVTCSYGNGVLIFRLFPIVIPPKKVHHVFAS